jgi:hypothetical protein
MLVQGQVSLQGHQKQDYSYILFSSADVGYYFTETLGGVEKSKMANLTMTDQGEWWLRLLKPADLQPPLESITNRCVSLPQMGQISTSKKRIETRHGR